jgi:hypothetical protein
MGDSLPQATNDCFVAAILRRLMSGYGRERQFNPGRRNYGADFSRSLVDCSCRQTRRSPLWLKSSGARRLAYLPLRFGLEATDRPLW